MKKLFALILTVAMLVTMSVTAFAATVDQGSTDPNGSMDVTYSVAPGYTVTIPPTVTIGTSGTSAEISAADVVVEKGQYVSVTLAENNDFTVKTAEGAELTYTVTANGENLAAGGEILAVNPTDGKTGTATITFDIDESAIQYAGTYTGSATFTIAVKDVSMISFTVHDNYYQTTTTYQAEAGMTWGEWVESAANNAGFYLGWEEGDDFIYWGEGYWYYLEGTAGAVKASDVIQAEAYILSENNG